MESGLYDNEFMGGRFYWWLGQVVDSKLWRENLTDKKTPSSEIPGWGYRYKVMIMGLHDQGVNEDFKDKLYWAQVMHSAWGGGEGGSFQTPGIKQGSFVFGWFLDGNDKQLPIIMGVLGKNAVTEIEKLGVQTYAGSSAYDNSGNTSTGDSELILEGNKKVLTNEAVDGPNVKVKADKVINDVHEECFHVECPDPREKSEMTGIQLAIEKMTSEVEKVQKSLVDLESAITLPVMKLDTEINDILDKYTGDVTDKMGVILGKVEHFSQASLTEKALGLIALAPPSMAKKLGKEQQEAAAKLACVFNKIKGNLFGLIGKALRKSFLGDGQRSLPPEGFYRPNPACATEDMIADVMVETLDEIVTTFNDANEGVVGQTGGGPLAGVRGAIGKLSNLQNLGSGVLTGALGGIGGGALGKLAGGLDFLKGFGALGGMNLDMSIAMTFVSGVKAFYDCDTKKKCSDYQRDCVKGVKNIKDKPGPENIAKNVSDKVKNGGEETTGTGLETSAFTDTEGTEVSPSNKAVFDNLTEGQKNRILNAPIGTNVEGVNVDEKVKFELRQYEMSGSETGTDNNDVAKNYLDNSLKKEETKPKTFKKPESSNNNVNKRIDELAALPEFNSDGLRNNSKIDEWTANELKSVAKSGNGTVNLRSNGTLALDANTAGRIEEHTRIVNEINSIEGSLIFDSKLEPNQTINNASIKLSDERIQKDKKKLLNLTKQLAYIEGGGVVSTNNRVEVDEWAKLKYELEE